jgi:hypothetical protein
MSQDSGDAGSFRDRGEFGWSRRIFQTVVATRVFVGTVAGALAVASALAVPAIGAPDSGRAPARARLATFFTPSSADPKLAALLAQSGLDATPFRFTPADSRRNDRRALDIAMRARSTKPGVVTPRAAGDTGASAIGVAPISYNMSASVAWKRLSVAGDVSKVDLGGAPGSRKSLDIGLTYAGKRAAAKLQARSDRPIDGETHLLSDMPSYSVDVGGSYSLTKNFDVTAGVRYKSQERDRLMRLSNDRLDSQAVYVGTAFRF